MKFYAQEAAIEVANPVVAPRTAQMRSIVADGYEEDYLTKVAFEFQIKNSRRDDLAVVLEPWGEVQELKAGGIIRLRVEGPASDDPSRVMVVRAEEGNRISVWGWTASSIAVIE